MFCQSGASDAFPCYACVTYPPPFPIFDRTNFTSSLLVMVSPTSNAKEWNVEVLSANHNADNDAEVERIRNAHPGEHECVIDRRVLGALAPTRCTSNFLASYLFSFVSSRESGSCCLSLSISYQPPKPILGTQPSTLDLVSISF